VVVAVALALKIRAGHAENHVEEDLIENQLQLNYLEERERG
jgi:hypothetical protein